MTDRENLISLIRRRGYERMPVDFSMTPDLSRRFSDFCRETGYTFPSSPFVNIPFSRIKQPRTQEFWEEQYAHGFKDNTRFDYYGVANEPGSEACMHMTRMYHPLEKCKTLEEIKSYPYPEFFTGPSQEQLKCVREAHENGKFALGNMQCTIWEYSWYLRSMEALMMDMLSDEESAEFVLDRVCENSVTNAVNFANAGADGLFLGDDIGMQSSIMMSLDLYRAFLKPRLARVIGEAKKVNPDIIVFYHSCGYVTPFIDDLIEAGVDVLNPIQPESMNFEEIFRKYGDRLSFCGTIGTQSTMPFGTPESIKKEIEGRLDFVGEKGGLLICPTHVLEPEVPLENIIAYIEACGNYKG